MNPGRFTLVTAEHDSMDAFEDASEQGHDKDTDMVDLQSAIAALRGPYDSDHPFEATVINDAAGVPVSVAAIYETFGGIVHEIAVDVTDCSVSTRRRLARLIRHRARI